MISSFLLNNIFFSSGLLLGPLRVLLLIGFLFLVKRFISLRASNQVGLDYIVSRYAVITSFVIILSFFLTIINAFDLMSVLVVSFLIMLFVFLDLNLKKPLLLQLKKIRKRILIYLVKSFELNRKVISKKNFLKPTDTSKAYQEKLSKKHVRWQLLFVITIAITTYAYRYYFFKFDTYMLSGLWYKDFEILKELNIQKGFFNQITGEYALINLYSKITGISEVIALQSFGLLESSILSIVIFWSVYKITQGRYVPALAASLIYIFGYMIIPFNINLITQHNSLYLAMSLAIPAIVYTSNPEGLRIKPNSYFKWMLILYFAIALTNLFVYFIVIPCALIILFLITEKQRREYLLKNVYAFLTSLILFLSIYIFIHWLKGIDFIQFIKNNILVISSYTYSPQLLIPIKKLFDYYLIVAGILLVVFAILFIRNRQKWKWAIAFTSFAFTLLTVNYFQFNFVDSDLMHTLATIILPILLGCLIYCITYPTRLLFSKFMLSNAIKIPLTTVAFILVIFYANKKTSFPFTQKNAVKADVLEAYTTISKTFLPYTYTVVDNKDNVGMSVGNHFFLNYNYFNDGYLTQDSIYFKNKENKAFLNKNPDLVLTESTLLFVYPQEENDLSSTIKKLKQRGRQINLYINKPHIKVYEIVNNPKLSKISDLLF